MKRFAVLVSLLFFVVVVGAWGQKVNVDFDKEANFASFKTYTWAEGTPAKNPLMDQRIRDGIDKQLAAKGLQKVEGSANPDLVVVYHAAVGTETQLTTMNTAIAGAEAWARQRRP